MGKTKETRVYLDNCCYNRPYDDQSQVRISLESQAKLAEADYLVSTDDRLLKYQTNDLQLVTPIEFLNKWEEIENDNEYE